MGYGRWRIACSLPAKSEEGSWCWRIALFHKLSSDGIQVTPEIVAAIGTFESEVEVLGVTADRIEETQSRAALKGERHHRSRALKAAEDPGLEVLPYEIPGSGARHAADALRQVLFHRVSYSKASVSASSETSSAARFSLGLPDASAWRRSSSRLKVSRRCSRSSLRYSGESPEGSR